MKKLFIAATILFACTAAWTSASAQHNVDREVNYYGVDFSKAKTFGAQETGEEFKAAVGGAGGFGLRNYWARALYNALRFKLIPRT